MTILLALLGAYLLVCLLLFVFQTRFVFFPDRQLIASPRHIGLGYEDVFFETEDGVRLHGWFVLANSQSFSTAKCAANCSSCASGGPARIPLPFMNRQGDGS